MINKYIVIGIDYLTTGFSSINVSILIATETIISFSPNNFNYFDGNVIDTSKLRQPESLGNEADMLQFLREQLSQEDQRELFLVLRRSPTEESAQRWLKESATRTET